MSETVNITKPITQSMLGNADKCLRSFQFAMTRPAWFVPTGGADRALGTGYHAALASYYTLRLTNPTALPDVEAMVGEGCRIFDVSMVTDLYDNTAVGRFIWSDKIPDQATAHDLIRQLVTYYVAENCWIPLDHQILAVELNEVVTDPESGRSFKLGCDVASLAPDGYVDITDHKTGGKAWAANKHDPRKQNQSPLYTWAARRFFGAERTRFVFDIITLPGARTPIKFDRRVTEPTPAHEAAVVAKAVDLMELFETMHVGLGRDLPANPASTLCSPKWCDYWDGCPHGAALDTPVAAPVFAHTPTPAPVADTRPDPHKHGKAFGGAVVVAATVVPDEGATVGKDDAQVTAVREAYQALDVAAKSWVDELRAQALGAGVDFHLAGNYTVRRLSIMAGLVALAGAGKDRDDLVRAIVRFAVDDDVVEWLATPAGAAIGLCDYAQAALFEATALLAAQGLVVETLTLDGPRLEELEAA
jgi:hypothetical protein